MNGDLNQDQSEVNAPHEEVAATPVVKATTILVRLLETRAFIFWGGLWCALVLIAFGSLGSLLSPNWVEGQAPNQPGQSPTAQTIPSPAQTATNNALQRNATVATNNQTTLPLWWFLAIPLSCIAGSFVLTQALKRPQQGRRRVKVKTTPVAKQTKPAISPAAQVTQGQPYQQLPTAPAVSYADLPMVVNGYPGGVMPVAPTPTPARRARPKKVARKPVAAKQSPPPKKSAPPPKRKASRPVGAAKSAKMAAKRVNVSVVPTGEVHPLDWQGASLADSVDLRKQRSVSSWL
ncbi:MAG TPA: hypothetical protein IGS53_16740 [Leptolyngbyaceae cyanobacterium M33_DOE_097]|uniref:Transmembrane protein n=1 Tax=Oscillatoriales cyanobacterium SpSt-418 TaxID=2282169 RepID=A0A7C3KH44_9CYAN|nr:hypothetical protein [Leptolyngbyaceae cyanobacterium M33_DOE_097]